jgi:hypothetical protein
MARNSNPSRLVVEANCCKRNGLQRPGVFIRDRVTSSGSRHIKLLIKLKQCVLLIELFKRLRLQTRQRSPYGAIRWTITAF